MQFLYKHYAVRAIIGGHWELSAIKEIGWYKHDRSGAVPPNIIASEDNTDIATSIRFVGLIGLLTVVLMAIVLLQAGVL